jgi:hypothetical protein
MYQENEDGRPEVIKVGTPRPELIRQLEKIAGMVADFHVIDGSLTTGVVLGTSSSAVILDLWDEAKRRPKGEPWVLDLSQISAVVIP